MGKCKMLMNMSRSNNLNRVIYSNKKNKTTYLPEWRVTGDEDFSYLSSGECLLKGEPPSTKASRQASAYRITTTKG